MTKWLWLFLAFYFLVGQPAILWWMQNDNNFYWLAWLNAWVFFVAWLISAMFNSSGEESNSETITSQLLWEKSENDSWSGVSVVKVQETTVKEIEVSKVDMKDEASQLQSALSGENNQKLKEDKWKTDTEEKTMKEWVTIPKIVQPLWASWRPAQKKKRKKEVSYGQWIVLLLTLAVAWIIAYTLWEFLWNWWVAIALFLGWILYLVIWKLFDVNGFYAARKLFTNWLYILLILWWIWYGIYATQQEGLSSFLPRDWADKISSYTSKIFGWDGEFDDGTWAIYVFEWTGEVITDSEGIVNDFDDTLNEDAEVLDDSADTWILENSEPEVNVQPEVVAQPEAKAEPEVKVEEQPIVSDDPNREITMWEAVKHLLQWYTLSTKNDKSFTYVAKSNELYPYFKTAQEKAMIWFDTNPNKRISCETYMSLMWILEWWSVNIYDRSQTRNIYWNKANELGKTNWCAKWSFVKVKNL